MVGRPNFFFLDQPWRMTIEISMVGRPEFKFFFWNQPWRMTIEVSMVGRLEIFGFFFQLDCYQDSDGKREIDQENGSKTRKNSETKIKKDPMMMGTKGPYHRKGHEFFFLLQESSTTHRRQPI
jgi:hypothetical protein